MSDATVKPKRSRAEHLGPERRRPHVLDTALAIAAEHGVEHVTMGAVAERMRVTRPVVYACFAGRGELLSALLERESSTMLRAVMATFPAPRPADVQGMFVDGFGAFLRSVAAQPQSWRIIFAAHDDAVLARTWEHGRRQVAEQVAAVMRPLLERRRIADLDEQLPVLVELFMAMGETAARMVLQPDPRPDVERVAEIVGRAAYRTLTGA